jgi:two-component system response regulator BaeR
VPDIPFEVNSMTPKKILVAEDDPSFQKLLLYKLKTAGYETRGVARGDEVIMAFGEFKPDLVILDGLLPAVNGFDLAKEIRSLPSGKAIPIVLLTGVYKETEYFKYAKEIGVNLHYDKSTFKDVEFLGEIQKLLS